ncbi:MAG: molybdenum cofactor biosynthesis protein MoaE [Actinomycetaceae bacterium]|nr:molybdenum cofactor biosynthesis protein MoaE [Actinomycetaceae bacterium]
MPDVVHSGIVSRPLDPAAIYAAAQDERCGAVAMFQGVVRGRSDDSPVVALDYTVHPSAPDILREIAEALTLRQGVHHVEAWHRYGRLEVGEIIMVVAVAAEHRGEAFAATQALVDEVKARLPVWKRQEFADGTHEWSGLRRPAAFRE